LEAEALEARFQVVAVRVEEEVLLDADPLVDGSRLGVRPSFQSR
jgi:hypothetical protein